MSFAFSRGEKPPKLALHVLPQGRGSPPQPRRAPAGPPPLRPGQRAGVSGGSAISRKDRRAKAAASSCGCMDGECETCYPVAERDIK